MKKQILFLAFVAACSVAYLGFKGPLKSALHLSEKKKSLQEIQENLSRTYPLLKDQKIVAIVYGENNALEVDRNLESLFNQTYPHYRVIYIDNGSTDGTFEKVRARPFQTRMEVIRFEQKKPIFEALYPLISRCDPDEIVALIEAKDWLSHENVFDHLNDAYANPNVWMTYSRAISHPDYQHIQGESFSDSLFLEKKLRQKEKKGFSPLVTFYAGFFHKIKLQDLLYHGEFIDPMTPLAFQLPLVEMGPEHVLFMPEVTYIKNNEKEDINHQFELEKMAAIESHLRSALPYPTLSHFSLENPPSLSHRYVADVVLFSEDTPLHLYACLESLFQKIQDIHEVYVLYKGSDQEFQRAYLNLQNEFPAVHFFNVCEYPGNDCASLIAKALEKKRHAPPFVVFGTDQVLFEEPVAFHEAIDAMERVHANYFLLNLEEKEGRDLPAAIPISKGIYAFQLGLKGAKHPLTFSLCRKTLFQDLGQVDSVPSFKKFWEKKLSPVDVALFYEEKKTFVINQACDASSSQKKEWGYRFIEGFKIDLGTLFCEVQEGGTFPLIKRERTSTHSIRD